MASSFDLERADELSRRRPRRLLAIAFIYLSQQVSYFASTDGEPAPVDHIKIGAWAVMSVVLLLAIMTKGFWLRPRAIRDLIDDELTRANRLDALRWGFPVMVAGGVGLYILDQVQPLTARGSIHAIVSLGLGVALLRFAFLEFRAHRG